MYRASYKGAMAHLKIILACFLIISSDFCFFRDFQLKRDRPTDQPTDRRTDKASYRVACPQLKKADRQTDQLSRLKSCMHATRKDGREEDRKVRIVFVSSCVAEHATVALWNNTLFRDKFYCWSLLNCFPIFLIFF